MEPQHCSHVTCEATKCTDCHCACDAPCEEICAKALDVAGSSPQGEHPCVGLCAESCVCVNCDAEAIQEAELEQRVDQDDVRFIKLSCRHISGVIWFDKYMERHDSYLRFPKCPKRDCGAQIRRIRRYHKVLERIRLNMLKVYEEVFGHLDKMMEEHQKLSEKFRSYHTDASTRNSDSCEGKNDIAILMRRMEKLSRAPSRFILNYLESLFTVRNLFDASKSFISQCIFPLVPVLDLLLSNAAANTFRLFLRS